jgi:phosphoribosylaminoimidazolecarboxamide formyltransferase / IMP cyclohydrolase
VGDSVLEAYRRARETDPVSAFGGIVAINRPVDAALARELAETFLECVLAPGYAPEALAALGAKKNLRVLAYDFVAAAERERAATGMHDVRSVSGGLLVQTRDLVTAPVRTGKVVTKRAPSEAELADLDFAWRVSKHVKSNAIVFAGGGRTLGVGAGQMSRVDSVRIAVSKARVPLAGSAVASDAYFPFRDGVDEAAKAGALSVIQPGGSMRDAESIAAADEHGMAMVMIGERHFRH